MGLKDELIADCAEIHASKWVVGDARVVPAPADVTLGTSAKKLAQAAVLYADLDGSTSMVDTYRWSFCAEVYKSFLRIVAKIVKSEGGTITAYDGDRLMAIFIGDKNCDAAVRSALKIQWAVLHVVNPAVRNAYKVDGFLVRHVVGIDVSDLHAVRTGVRGDNDLVWVGRAANYAAKLTSLSSKTPTWITKDVHDKLSQSLRSKEGNSIWENRLWTSMSDHPVRCSHWFHSIS